VYTFVGLRACSAAGAGASVGSGAVTAAAVLGAVVVAVAAVACAIYINHIPLCNMTHTCCSWDRSTSSGHD